MAKELVKKVQDLERCLLRNGFKKTNEVYDLEAFGNELIVYVSSQIKMRVIKDRGYFYVEALPADLRSDDWILITRVIDYIKNTAPLSFNLSKVHDEWGCLIDEICLNISVLSAFFDKNNYEENIKKLELHEEDPEE